MKIRTDSQLHDLLDYEWAWRLKEIADMKVSISTTAMPRQRSVVRSAIPIAYAHWEGFVKVASEAYLNYIQFQNLRFRELKTCFIVLGCKKHVSRLVDSGRSSMTIEAVTFLRANMNDFAAFSLASAIDTESNLSSAVFENVATSIGIDTTPYQTKYKYIDINLVEARNKVAHGEIHGIKPEDCRSLCDHVIDLIRRFKTDIQNAVALRRYRN